VTLSLPILLGLGLAFINPWFIVGGIVIAAIMSNNLPWNKQIKEELKKRETELAEIKDKLQTAIKEFNSPNELRNYENSSKQIENSIILFRNIPNELQAKRKVIEERLYTEQLHQFLATFEIRHYPIPSFGATRKLTLYAAGIRNASEISKLNRIKVQGIGSKFEQTLFSWQRQISSRFVYHPDNNLINKEYSLAISEFEQKKKQLENEIKKEYQSLQYLKTSITTKQEQIKKYVSSTMRKYFQIQVDYQEFKKIVA